jgi:hypothetical protein
MASTPHPSFSAPRYGCFALSCAERFDFSRTESQTRSKFNAIDHLLNIQYQRVPDPACASVSSNLKAFCTNTALADANGNIALRNAAPGQLGTLGLNPIAGPGLWSLDGNLQKSIRITESRNLSFRMDATNLFNHPTPANPNLNINSGTFGQIASKTGNRMLAAQIHLDF